MTAAADVLLTNARVYPLAGGEPGDPSSAPGHLAPDASNDEPDPAADAVAIRDGEIVAVGAERDLRHLADVSTRVVDLDGRVLLPGFVDAHTHLLQEGLAQVHADLAGADDRDEALERLHEQAAAADSGWVIGLRYDESAWTDARPLQREELDDVTDDRPVAAVRVDMHTASLNSAALERVSEAHADHVETDEADEPTGVVTERAVGVVEPVFDPDRAATRDAIEAAIDRATALGITCVHDKVRRSHAPRVYRDLAREDDLDCRVRVDYWSDHCEALSELGLRTGDGGDPGGLVRVGGIKTFSDGSIGGRTARLTEPYADAAEGDEESDGDEEGTTGDESEGDADRGEWVVEPGELERIASDAVDAGCQVQVHAIGDEAIERSLDAIEEASGSSDGAPDDGRSDDQPPGSDEQPPGRHRIEHAELATDAHVARMADAGVVASMQPNFHRWAGEGGLYEHALGPERTARTNRLRTVSNRGVALAFGSDCMPMDPLYGVQRAVNAPEPAQRLSVGAALRAYTLGSAYAAFEDEDLGTIEVGKRADLVALEASPWERADAIEEIDEIEVALTTVDGRVVHEGR